MKKTLKNMLQSKRMTRIVGAYDALSGLLVQQAGFDAIWGSGFCVSASHGLPDANIIGCDTVIKSYADIARATDIPVIADCDTGYGNFHNVIYATRELERHNIKGICIEDKVYPKINSLFPGVTHMLDSPENFVNKIKAAADARKNSDFCIIARTEALVAGFNIDEVLYRADLYRCAGADAIIIHSRESDVGKILKVFEIWDGRLPLIAIPTSFPQISFRELEKYKVYNVIIANQMLRAGVAAMKAFLKEVKCAASLAECKAQLSSMGELFELQKMDEYNKHDAYYNSYAGNIKSLNRVIN